MYAQNYFKNIPSFDDFFKNINDTEEKKIRKEIDKTKAKLDELSQKFTEECSKRYSGEITYVSDRFILVYHDRNRNNNCFDLITGAPYDDNEEETVKKCFVSSKTGEVKVLVGYCYDYGAIFYRRYKYSINASKTKMSSSLEDECLVPIFETGNYSKNGTMTLYDLNESAQEFLNTFFGIEKDINFNFAAVRRYYLNNPSFEIIIRTAKNMEEMTTLLNIKCEKPMPIHNILGCTKKDYDILSKNNMVTSYVKIKDFLTEQGKEDFKTSHEIIEFMVKCKKWEEDLDFYKIDYNDDLALSLICAYSHGTIDIRSYGNCFFKFPKYYPFGKFCNYVVTESINQGYTRIKNFIIKLRDYIIMCDDLDIVPTLYSSYLAITHDITSRNHSIAISEDQERIFKNKYKDFETYRGKDYMVIAPKDSKDVMEEGDKLNHCVASYIKKILDGACNILFMRSVEDITKRLITVEVVGDTVCQATGLHDRDITEPEKNALMEFCKERGLKFRI